MFGGFERLLGRLTDDAFGGLRQQRIAGLADQDVPRHLALAEALDADGAAVLGDRGVVHALHLRRRDRYRQPDLGVFLKLLVLLLYHASVRLRRSAKWVGGGLSGIGRS